MSYTAPTARAGQYDTQAPVLPHYISGQGMITSGAIKTAADLAAVKMPFEPPNQDDHLQSIPASGISRLSQAMRAIFTTKWDQSEGKAKEAAEPPAHATRAARSRLPERLVPVKPTVCTDFADALPHYKHPVELQLDDGNRFTMSMESLAIHSEFFSGLGNLPKSTTGVTTSKHTPAIPFPGVSTAATICYFKMIAPRAPGSWTDPNLPSLTPSLLDQLAHLADQYQVEHMLLLLFRRYKLSEFVEIAIALENKEEEKAKMQGGLLFRDYDGDSMGKMETEVLLRFAPEGYKRIQKTIAARMATWQQVFLDMKYHRLPLNGRNSFSKSCHTHRCQCFQLVQGDWGRLRALTANQTWIAIEHMQNRSPLKNRRAIREAVKGAMVIEGDHFCQSCFTRLAEIYCAAVEQGLRAMPSNLK